MKILRAFKTELDLNNKQKTACRQHAGAARFAYNWGLDRKKAAFAHGEKTPTAIDLHRELNELKKSELSWMYEVSKCAPQEALRDLDQAFAHFFRRLKDKRAGEKIKLGFPRFKSKKSGAGSFRLTGVIRVFEKSIQLPRLGLLRLKERGYLPTTGVHILSATVSEKAGCWFVSLQVEMELPELVLQQKPVVGVDLGINRMAQAIGDVGMHEFRRQLQYKGAWYGCQVLLADKFYPSTKRCSRCGAVREIGLTERQYHCPVCGLLIDRDLNAAINLEQLFLKETTASSAERYACGELVRPGFQAMLAEAGTEHQSVMDRFEYVSENGSKRLLVL